MAFPDSTYEYYEIDIDSTNIDSDLVDFPVRCDLAKLPTAVREWLEAELDASGNGIRVTNESDTVLDYTLENFAKAAGVVTGELVFKCSPTSASDLTVRLYADSVAGNAENQSGVYAGTDNAYNFEQDPSTSDLIDIAGSLDLPVRGTMTAGDLVDGLFGSAWQFDGVDDRAGGTAADNTDWPSTTITEWSFIVWVDAQTIANDNVFLANDDSGWDKSFQLGIKPENVGVSSVFGCNHQGGSSSGGRSTASCTTALSVDTWYQVAIRADSGATMRIYQDGAEEDSDPLDQPVGGAELSPGVFTIGAKEAIREWPGKIDSVHMFESDIGAAWIKFDYYNMTDSTNELQNFTKVTPGGGTTASTLTLLGVG